MCLSEGTVKKKLPGKGPQRRPDRQPEEQPDSWENPFSYPMGDPMDGEDQVPPFSAFTLQDHDPLTVPYPDGAEEAPDETAERAAEKPRGKKAKEGPGPKKPRDLKKTPKRRYPRPPASGRSPAARQRKPPDTGAVLRRLLLVLSIALLSSLMLTVLTRRAAWVPFRSGADALLSDRFFTGVRVDGTDLSGMTYSQAENVLAANARSAREDIRLTILAGDASAVFSAADIAYSRNIEDALGRAYAAGRSWDAAALEEGSSPFEERRRAVRNLREEGLSLTSSAAYSREAVEAFAAALADRIDRPAVSSRLQDVDFVHRVFSYTEDQTGLMLDREDLADQICAALDQGAGEAEIRARMVRTAPKVRKTDLMNRFGLMNVRSVPTSTRTGDAALRALVRTLNGIVVQSGETFSFHTAMERAGYTPSSFEEDPVPTQIATALMDGALCAGLRLETRFALDEKSPLVPAGMEALITPEKDLVLRNESGAPACVLCYYTSRSSAGTAGDVTLEWYGLTPEAGEEVSLTAEKTGETAPGPPVLRVNPALPAGRQFLIREQEPGEEWACLLVYARSGREYRRETLFTTSYPAKERIIEYNDEGAQP